MNPNQPPASRQRELFLTALDHPDLAERRSFLEAACGTDVALRESVDALLAHHQKDSFLEGSPAIAALTAEHSSPGLPFRGVSIGDRIGRYKLLQKMGEGGCGVVYMAEQEEPVRRRVALKVIKLGMDTHSVIARFEAERQALAMMDHPNIATVFEAGATASGRPYFVMELVRGLRITDYCDQHQLGTRQRLELFIKVCQAVQHAHQKGIIHRDLKPSNVLVTLHDGVAVPKIIDFGIAKTTSDQRLTDKTFFTALEQFVGTPTYMSPEQAELSGRDIDTRSDIYSLGVLLYELLTGKPPFDAHELLSLGLDALRRIIREQEPVRPSTRLSTLLQAELTVTARNRQSDSVKLIHLLRGDVDWIVMKCLEKDRARRYETANGLARDIQRHLNNETVLARPPSALYRFRKLVRRNKLAFAAVTAVATVLVLGVAVSTRLAIRATREQHKAFEAQQNEKAQRNLADQALSRARQIGYGAETSLAFAALELDNFGQARELLTKQQARRAQLESATDLRGWEWRHLYHQTRGDEHVVLKAPSSQAAGALFLNDGLTLVSSGADDTLRLWDLQSRAILRTIPLHSSGARFPSLSSDGRWLAVSGDPWRLLETDQWRVVSTGTNSGSAAALAFSDDSRRIALLSGSEVRVLDLGSHALLLQLDRGTMQWERNQQLALAFSPDGHSLAYGDSDDTLRLYRFGDQSQLILRPAPAARSVTFTRDGKFLISGGRSGIDVWNVATGGLVQHLAGHRDEVTQVAVSCDGRLLASASVDQTIRMWETASWKEARTLRGSAMAVSSVGFSPDGKMLVSAEEDESLRVWSVEQTSGREDRYVSPDNAPFHWPFAPGTRVALVHGNLPYAPGMFQVSNSGRIAAELRQLGNQGALSYLDCLTFEESPPEATPPHFSSAQLMVFGRDARSMAIGWPDGRIELWATGPLRHLRDLGHSTNTPLHLVLSGNGQRLAVHRSDNTLEIWNPVTGTLDLHFQVTTQLSGGPNCGFWAQDRILALLSAGSDTMPQAIDLWFLPEGRRRVFPHPNVAMWTQAISNDGRWLATSGWDGILRFWDVENVQQVEKITGQRRSYYSLVFSPDDSRLVGGGFDGTITMWDMATRQQVAHWKAHERECAWLRFVGPHDDLISMGNLDNIDRYQGETRRWRAPPLSGIDSQK